MSRDRPAGLREWMCNCQCIYDGGELGSTSRLVELWSCPDVSSVNANKTINADENLALAA